MATPFDSTPPRNPPALSLFGQLITRLMSLPEIVLTPLQRILGTQRMGYFFVLPNMLIFALFILLPMLLNFYYGFTGGTSILPENRIYTGTENLQRLMTCEDYLNYRTCDQDRFWRAFGNTVIYVSVEVAAMVGIALVTALALNRKLRGITFFRSVFFYPVLLSPVVVALIWKWIIQDTGVLNGLLVALGGEKQPFSTDAGWATFWVIAIGIWAQMGFYTLILLAGLQSIPVDLYEAASVAGANAWNKLRFITLPLLMPTMTVVLVLALIRAVQVFDHVFVLTGGGPGTATLYVVQYIYQTVFEQRNYGIAAAASLMLAAILLVLTFAQLRLRRAAFEGEQ